MKHTTHITSLHIQQIILCYIMHPFLLWLFPSDAEESHSSSRYDTGTPKTHSGMFHRIKETTCSHCHPNFMPMWWPHDCSAAKLLPLWWKSPCLIAKIVEVSGPSIPVPKLKQIVGGSFPLRIDYPHSCWMAGWPWKIPTDGHEIPWNPMKFPSNGYKIPLNGYLVGGLNPSEKY